MRVVLREHGFEPTEELLEMYHQVNGAAWAAFERGEVTKEKLVPAVRDFFGKLGRQVDGAQVESMYRGLFGQVGDSDRRGAGGARVSAGPVQAVYCDQRDLDHAVQAAGGLGAGSVRERYFCVRGRGEPEAPEGVLCVLLLQDSGCGPVADAAGGRFPPFGYPGRKRGRDGYLLVQPRRQAAGGRDTGGL